MTTIYLAEVRYGDYHICSIDVTKETAKQYRVDVNTKKAIHGSVYINKVINKDSRAPFIFLSLKAALIWCRDRMMEQTRQKSAELSMMQNAVNSLNVMAQEEGKKDSGSVL